MFTIASVEAFLVIKKTTSEVNSIWIFRRDLTLWKEKRERTPESEDEGNEAKKRPKLKDEDEDEELKEADEQEKEQTREKQDDKAAAHIMYDLF